MCQYWCTAGHFKPTQCITTNCVPTVPFTLVADDDVTQEARASAAAMLEYSGPSTLTQWGQDKMSAILIMDNILKFIFLRENIWISIKKNTEICSQGSNWQYADNVSDNGLAPNIIWSKDELGYRCINATLRPNELKGRQNCGAVMLSNDSWHISLVWVPGIFYWFLVFIHFFNFCLLFFSQMILLWNSFFSINSFVLLYSIHVFSILSY